MKISDPLIELLAITLYEHDHDPWPSKYASVGWLKLPEEDREIFRAMARGENPLSKVE